MTKRFVCLAAGLLVVMASSTCAQVHLQWGVAGGLSMYHESMHESISEAGMTSTFDTSTDTKTGFVGGIVLDIDLLNLLSIEPGIFYCQRGGQMTFSGDALNPSSTLKQNLDYLSIPVHAKLKWPGLPLVKPYALAGINVAFLLSAKEDDGTTSEDVDSTVSSIDFGLDFGGGIEFDLPVIVPYVEYVFDLGLGNLIKNPVGDETAKSRGSEIKVGIRFKI